MMEKDYERINRLNLSPLYISVHTVDKKLRADILRSKKIISIKEKLKKLKDMNIVLHTQIVLMPGINDGENLIETLDFLTGLYPAVQTISLVPVGLTHFRDNLYPLDDYSKKEARAVIEIAEKYQKKFIDKYEEVVVYITDEFYIKADMEFPEYKRYEIYEDGVGMYQVFKEKFYNNLDILKNKNFDKSKKIAIITSVDGKKVLDRFIKKIKKYGIRIESVAVVNDFFGERVTVTGLLTGIDIKRKIQNIKDDYDKILIPDIVLNEEDLLLDDYHKNDLIEIEKSKIEFINTDAKSLIEKVAE
jgi:putative radical SAM enzyme (TIGR03279 family)